MSVIPGLSTNVIKYINYSQMYTIENLLKEIEPTYTLKYLEELTSTIDSMTTMFLLEGANPNYNVQLCIGSAKAFVDYISQASPEVEELLETSKLSLVNLKDKIERLETYYNNYIALNVAGNTPEEKMDNVMLNFEQNSEYVKSLSKYYNTLLTNLFTFANKAPKSIKYPEGSETNIKHCCNLPNNLSDLIEDKDPFSKYTALILAMNEFIDKNDTIAIIHQLMNIYTLNATSISQALNVPLENVRPIIDSVYIDELRRVMLNGLINPYARDTVEYRVNPVSEETVNKLTDFKTLSEVKSAFEEYLQDNPNPEFKYNDFKTYIEVNPLTELQSHMLNILLINSMHLFITYFYSTDLLQAPVEQLRHGEDPFTGYNLDRFVFIDEDFLSTPEMHAVTQTWWRFYAHYSVKLQQYTKLLGLTPRKYGELGYFNPQDSRTFFDDTLQTYQLTRFAIQSLNDANSLGLKVPSKRESLTLVNHMFKLLADGQYTSSQQVKYEATIIKPAMLVISSFRDHLTEATTYLDKVAKVIGNYEYCTEELSTAVTSIYSNLEVVKHVLECKDWSLVPPDISQWGSCNTLLGDGMRHLLAEYTLLVHFHSEINRINEEVRFKHDIFDNSKMGLTNDNVSLFRTAKNDEPRSIRGVISTQDNQGNVTVDLMKTRLAVSQFKNNVANTINVLNHRLDIITQYESANDSTKTFKSIKQQFVETVTQAINQENVYSSLFDNAINLHYGHLEINPSIPELKSREGRLEPVKIEHSKTKPIIESTRKFYREWHLKLEARQFMLDCIPTAELIRTPVW